MLQHCKGQLLKKDLRDSMNILLNLQEREEAIYNDIDEKKKNKNFCKKRLSHLTKRCEYLVDEIKENQKIVKANKRKVAKWEDDQKKKRKKKNNKNKNQLVSEIVTPLPAQPQPRRAVRTITETAATVTSNVATSTAVSSAQASLNVTSTDSDSDSDSESVEVTENETIALDDSPGEAIIRKGKQLIQSSSDDDSDAFSY